MIRKFTFFSVLLLSIILLSSCDAEKDEINRADENLSFDNSEMKIIGSMEIKYAKMFSVDYLENGMTMITIKNDEKYLIVPPNCEIPFKLSEDITIIGQPVKNIYLAASSAMDLFSGINSTECIRFTSTKEKDWALADIRELMEEGKILYAGKYSAPDYELILSEDCGMAIESTMINHSPEIKEQLENCGIPVLTEYSSYEEEPLGRMEWIKLYGVLTGKEKEALDFFEQKMQILENIDSKGTKGKTAAFFYITSNGSVNIRKPGDYVSKMIELSGGEYIFKAENLNEDENALSTMNIQFETFYSIAKDADFLIYNGTVDGGVLTTEQLVEKNRLLSEFKAVKNGNVWCSEKNMFQQTTAAADMILEMNKIFNEKAENNLEFFCKLS